MVWPFKKVKPRIRDSWLAENSISTRWSDSFNKSNRELTADIKQQSDILLTHEARLKELEASKNKIDMEMTMHKEASNEEGISDQVKKDYLAKMALLEAKFKQDLDNSLTTMKSIREASNTRWLLENIKNKVFTDPERLSDPPVFEAKSWSQIFAELPETDDLEEDYLHEMFDHFGNNYTKKTSEDSEQKTNDIDDLV